MIGLAELWDLYPEGRPARVAGYPAFWFLNVTPAHTFEALVAEVRGRLVELTARDSYDRRLASFLIRRAASLEWPEPDARSIRVAPARFPPPWSFSALVLVPPAVARRFEHESEALQRLTYWAVPAFEGEFSDGDDERTFWHQLRRTDGWRIHVVQWDRARKTEPAFD